jgi:anti-sigma regulatory factor (Ser/Thr protein kinase)
VERLLLPPEPDAARRARAWINWHLAALAPTLLARVVLCTSELVTNAALHAGTEIEVVLEIEIDRYRISVTDGDVRMPVFRMAGPFEPGGRGLQIVEALAARWGTIERTAGKTVWFEINDA